MRSRNSKLVVVMLGVSVALFGYQWTVSEPESAALLFPGDVTVVERGAEVYAVHCAFCHGSNLEGQPNWRVRNVNGRLPAPPHDETGHTWHHPDELLFQITKLGTEALVGGDYRSDMIGFGNVLADEDIIAALTYIKSTWPEHIQKRHDEINARSASE